MLTVIRCNSDFVDDDTLQQAKEKLQQFHKLNWVFNNFDNPSFSNYHNSNTVFRNCLRPDNDSFHYLRRIENALINLIEHDKLSTIHNTKFIKRITSDVPGDFVSAIS